MVTYATMFIAMSVWLFTRLYVFPFDVIIPCARKLLEM